ncbi:hypothetical protein GE061_018821 [Apolygus lucorum]|uniref:Uncharacterized protein n=1 Tax=Apolygus lucorum TaxID=248454 RepID=A0A8S9X8L8_APOLU|nr:hypothetical protein GE061_018821 [Apolygus lucorum]
MMTTTVYAILQVYFNEPYTPATNLVIEIIPIGDAIIDDMTTAFCWFYHLDEAFTRFVQQLVDDGHTNFSSFRDELLVHSGMWEVAQDISQTVSDTLELKLHSPPKLRDLGLVASLPAYGYLRPCDVPATIMDSLTNQICKNVQVASGSLQPSNNAKNTELDEAFFCEETDA